MDNVKMGQFILDLRKSHQMTQKDLAAKLNVTDKAVSKWERGLSCPDISLLAPLSDIFGVTINDLLNGGKNDVAVKSAEADIVNALQYADKAGKNKAELVQNITAIAFSSLLFLGIVICAIIDVAISGSLTWSLIPISSCVFAWLTFIPAIKHGTRGIAASLAAFSIFLVPFLFVLSSLIDTGGLLMSIGIGASLILIIYLWSVFALFKIFRSRVFIVIAISLTLAIPCTLAINFTLSRIIDTPLFDVWSALGFAATIVLAIVLAFIDFITKKNG